MSKLARFPARFQRYGASSCALLILAFFALSFALPGSAVAADEARLVVGSGQPADDGLTRMKLAVEGLPLTSAFNGYEVLLEVDPAVARVVAVEAGGNWNIDLVPPVIDAAAGTVRITAISLVPSCGAGCDLATIVLAGVGAGGSTPVVIAGATLAAGGFPITTTTSPDGQAVVAPSADGPLRPFRVYVPSAGSDGVE